MHANQWNSPYTCACYRLRQGLGTRRCVGYFWQFQTTSGFYAYGKYVLVSAIYSRPLAVGIHVLTLAISRHHNGPSYWTLSNRYCTIRVPEMLMVLLTRREPGQTLRSGTNSVPHVLPLYIFYNYYDLMCRHCTRLEKHAGEQMNQS